MQLEVEEKAEARAAEEAQFLRDQCNADLEASMPPLRRVLKELQSINKNDIAELKSLKSPPMGVKFVMKARAPRPSSPSWDRLTTPSTRWLPPDRPSVTCSGASLSPCWIAGSSMRRSKMPCGGARA